MIKRILIFTLAVGAAALSSPAFSAESMATGNGLLANCTGPNGSFGSGLCLGFITGAVDRDELAQMMNSPDASLCPMPRVSIVQIQEVVVRYLRDHPEKRHFHGANLVMTALRKAFCSEVK